MVAVSSSPVFDNDFPLATKSANRNQIKRQANKAYFRELTALANALIGATSGSGTGAITRKRIKAAGNGEDGGGKRTIETETVINRNTTADDVTALKEMLYNVRRAPTYVADRSGNGGPAFTPGA